MKNVVSLFGKVYFVLPILFLAVISNAQITESSLRGIVTDVNGNIVASSAVVAQNDATAQVKTTTTNENGEFVFASLPSGSYTVFVRVTGFKTYELKNLKLNVGQTSELNIKLEIGEVSANVTIGADESLSQVQNDARISDTFTRQARDRIAFAATRCFCSAQTFGGCNGDCRRGKFDQIDKFARHYRQWQSLSW